MNHVTILETRRLLSGTPDLTASFDSFATANTASFVPADPVMAAGPNFVVTVVNSNIGYYTKTGVTAYNATLATFFGQADPNEPAAPYERLVDPRVMYDQYRGRFIVSAYGTLLPTAQNPTPPWRRGVWVAVSNDADPSDTGNPAGSWETHFFNASTAFDPAVGEEVNAFPDFPNLAVGPDAVYICANMFSFSNRSLAPRLWILAKDPLYDQDPSTRLPENTATFNPKLAPGAPSFFSNRLLPSQMFGTPPAGVGSFLVAKGENEVNINENDVVHVARIEDPLGVPRFSWFTVSLGPGRIGFTPDPTPTNPPEISSNTISLNRDQATPEPVWRNDALWATQTSAPGSASPESDQGQESVYWMKINTSTMSVAEQGYIGGEEIAPGTRTGFGAIAVNAVGDASIGFSAVGPGIYAGAYYAVKRSGDASFQPAKPLAAGEAYWSNTRWGDYSGMGLDPTDDTRFWVYNMYAGPTDRWKTRVGTFSTMPKVLDRHVFYNNSWWDGFDAPNNHIDDGALASNKEALRPGQSATFANYTSFSKGLNGITFEIDGLADDATLSASDFVFRAGNDANPSGWAAAPNPSSIVVRRVPGVWGTRVAMVWPDYNPGDPNNPANAVANKWLQVTIKATANTGLSIPDVFYFGNLIGDTGINTSGPYATLAEDYSATKAVVDDPAQESASITSFFDHDRDGIHDEDDKALVQANFFKTLLLLTAPV